MPSLQANANQHLVPTQQFHYCRGMQRNRDHRKAGLSGRINTMTDEHSICLAERTDAGCTRGRLQDHADLRRWLSTCASKPDASPVTEADTAAEAIIVCAPESPVRRAPTSSPKKRSPDGAIPQASDEFYLVDPLDGTREFISRNGEFTVNIALVRDGASGGRAWSTRLPSTGSTPVSKRTGAWMADLKADQPWPGQPANWHR
jgi:hypothetical protein